MIPAIIVSGIQMEYFRCARAGQRAGVSRRALLFLSISFDRFRSDVQLDESQWSVRPEESGK